MNVHLNEEPLGIRARIANFRHALTATEVGELFALSPKTIYKKARIGAIPSVRFEGVVRFDPKKLADWYDSQCIERPRRR